MTVRSRRADALPRIVHLDHTSVAGGAEYARKSAEEFGIAHLFVSFLPKPNVIIDDQRVIEWPRFLHVHPSSILSFGEYRASLAVPRD